MAGDVSGGVPSDIRASLSEVPTGPSEASAAGDGHPSDGSTWTLFSARGHDVEVGRCLVMAILNATPDSFSDGGELLARPALQSHVAALLEAGADILDIGGESTRPGHAPVSADEEKARVLPVIEAIRDAAPAAWISIDTSKADVARAALDAGADLVNDVSGLADPAMARLVSDQGCSVVLMRHDDCVGDVVGACRDQLRSLVVRARSAGVSDEQVILDPGLGFGKRPGPVVEDNLALIDRVQDYAMGFPVLVGASRKRFVGAWSGVDDVQARDAPSCKLAVRSRDAGAAIVRVHDVAGTVQALRDG